MKTKISYLLFVTLSTVLAWCAFSMGNEINDSAEQGLIGHWPFDSLKQGRLRNAAGIGLDAIVLGDISMQEGVFETALYIKDRHAIRIKANETFNNLSSMTISAWVSPTELSGYREIFRKEDGDRRILFSFQHGGTILSLGLNVEGSGYEELDAKVQPALLKNLQWHHVVGTFDGEKMRVYLDGLEIGSKKKPGRMISGGGADAFLGSLAGRGEFYQGLIDDLRIYNIALTGEQITELHEKGLSAIHAKTEGYQEHLTDIYEEKLTFAQTMAATRKNLKDRNASNIMLRLIQAKLASRFSRECVAFSEATESQPYEYLTAADNSWNVSKAKHLIALLTEYKPLTERQWARISDIEKEKWKETEHLSAKLERLMEMGESGTFDAGWVELMLEAGRQIVHRPKRYEAVAPYVKPYTPVTRDYSEKEAEDILQRDWLHQAEGVVTAQGVKREIEWTRDIAGRILRNHPNQVDFSNELSKLKVLETEVIDGELEQLYYTVRSIKRRVMFSDPVVDFDSVLFIDIPYPAGSEWPHETRHRLGYMAVPGGRLLTLKGLSPAGHLTKLMPVEPLHGTFWRPDLSFDAKRVLFSFHPANEKNFHLYEINIDGSGLRQISGGIYDDVDPIYLPDDEHIIFASTRGHNYVRCMPPTNSFVLMRCDLDGSNMYIISRNNEPDYLPALLSDGRVIYTRWEYTDKPLWRAQSLWTMNPDGTRAATFWGNQSVWPDLLKDARSIPGSERVMFTGSAHHNWFAGSIGMIDTRKGFNFPDGLTKVTPELEWPESGNGPVDPIESKSYHKNGNYLAYQTPYPLSEEVFLVSANREGKFVLYLMDTLGNKELIYEGAHNIFHAMPLKPRPRPSVIPDAVQWPSMAERYEPAGGIIFSNNVYHNAPAKLQGKARYLRILTMDAKTYSYWYKRPYASTGPVVSMISSEGVKRILGTVPIEDDGSVHFKAPSGYSLYFQLLDDKYRALQTMRSISGVMPGETRGCLGCHEMHSVTPTNQVNAKALRRVPSEIVPPPWGKESISYMRFVQPVLDKHCGQCHQGDGEARNTLDLTYRGDGLFKEPYVHLIGNPTWGAPYQPPDDPPPGFGIADTIMVEAYDQRDPVAYETPEPMTKLSYKSRLVDIASSGKHHGVKVDELSRRKLIAWVDTMCPYRGDEEVRQIDDPEFQGIEWLAIRPQIKNAPIVVRPGPVDYGP